MRIVVLIDDQVASLSAVVNILEHQGFTVLTTANPDEAFGYCQHLKVDLVIADLILQSRLSGTDVALQIRQHCPDVPVLFISGTPLPAWSPRDLTHVEEMIPSRVDFLAKPFTSRMLSEAVSNLMAETYSDTNIRRLLQESANLRKRIAEQAE